MGCDQTAHNLQAEISSPCFSPAVLSQQIKWVDDFLPELAHQITIAVPSDTDNNQFHRAAYRRRSGLPVIEKLRLDCSERYVASGLAGQKQYLLLSSRLRLMQRLVPTVVTYMAC